MRWTTRSRLSHSSCFVYVPSETKEEENNDDDDGDDDGDDDDIDGNNSANRDFHRALVN